MMLNLGDNSELKLESYNEDSMIPQSGIEADRTIFPYGYERKGEMSVDEMKAYLARKTQTAIEDQKLFNILRKKRTMDLMKRDFLN